MHSLCKIAKELEQITLSYAAQIARATGKDELEYREKVTQLLLQVDSDESHGLEDVRRARKVLVDRMQHWLDQLHNFPI